MNKLIKEEINRIREVMGLKLLKESIVPTGVIKSLLSDFATVVGKNLDDITQMTNSGARKASVVGLYDSLKNSTDQSVKNFVDSVDEVASAYNREVADLLDEISTGKVADEIQDEIFTKIASKTTGVDAKLVDLLPDDVASYYKQASNSYTRFENNLDGLIEAYRKDPVALQKAIDKNVEIRNAIVNLPDGPFKQKLLADWDNQLKFFDDNIVKKIEGGADESGEAAAKQTDEVTNEVEKVRFTQEDIDEVMGVAGTTKPLQGELANYMTKKFNVLGFDSWKRFSVEEQNKIILEMSSQINTAFEKKIKELGWDSGLVAANKMIQQMEKGGLSATVMEKVFRDTIAKSKPSFGPLGNVLNGLVEYVSGISARQGKIFWTTTGGWSEITKRWILFNLGLAVAEGTYRFYTTREEPTAEGLLNILEQRIDFLGLAQRVLLPLPLISRIFVSESVQTLISAGALSYDGFRQLTEAQISDEFGDTNVEVLDINQFPCYDTFADKLKGFSKRANYFKVNGQNKGIWALNLLSGEVVQIQTPMSDDCSKALVSGTTPPAPPPPPPAPQQDEMKEFESYVKQLWGPDSKDTDTYFKRGNTFIADDGDKEYEFVRDGNSFRQTK